MAQIKSVRTIADIPISVGYIPNGTYGQLTELARYHWSFDYKDIKKGNIFDELFEEDVIRKFEGTYFEIQWKTSILEKIKDKIYNLN